MESDAEQHLGFSGSHAQVYHIIFSNISQKKATNI